MSSFSSYLSQPLLVSFGAVLGSWMRFKVVNFIDFYFPGNYFGTLLVNLVSTFSLGFFFAHTTGIVLENISLFFVVGFLGSLSTFSTFIVELLELLQGNRLRECLLLAGGSICLGLLVMSLGYFIGNA